MKIKNLPYNFQALPTIGDGNCFTHAILGCCSKDYQQADIATRIKLARQFRDDLAAVLDVKISDKTIYQNLSRGTIEEIAKEVREMNKRYMQSHLKSRRWLNGNYLELFSNMLQLNIIVISSKEKDLYRTGDKEITIQDRDTIFINYIDQAHFESIGVETEDGLKTLFGKNSKIVKDVKKVF